MFLIDFARSRICNSNRSVSSIGVYVGVYAKTTAMTVSTTPKSVDKLAAVFTSAPPCELLPVDDDEGADDEVILECIVVVVDGIEADDDDDDDDAIPVTDCPGAGHVGRPKPIPVVKDGCIFRKEATAEGYRESAA